MEQFLIFLMLVGGSRAFLPIADTKCNATESTCLCSVILGGTVYIQMLTNASSHVVRCKKELPSGLINVFTLQNEKVTIQDAFKNRTEFFINNGTLKITNMERNDSGQYSGEAFDPNGVLVKNIHFKLDVKENILTILIPVCAGVGALLILVSCCCVCRKVKRSKKSGSSI